MQSISEFRAANQRREDLVAFESQPVPLASGAPYRVPGVAVEILVEEDVVAEMQVAVQLVVVGQDRPPAMLIPQEDAGQPAGQLVSDLVDRQELAGAGRTLDLEIVAVVMVELLQRVDEQ